MTTTTRRAARLTAVAGAATALTALAAGPALAAGSAPSDEATGTPGADTATTLGTPEQVAPLVQPSVVYEQITWTGYVYDRFNGQYLRGKPFTIPMQCTGFVVNPDGWIGTAGHCVDTAEGKQAIKQAAAEWALANYYDWGTALSVEDVIGDYRIDIVDDNGSVKRDSVERDVRVSWGAAVSGIDVMKSKPARVVAYQAFDEGDGALLKVDQTDLNAIELADSESVEINSPVIAIGYPAIIDAFTDPDLTPTFDPGNVSSIKTVADGLLSVFQLSAELSGGMSGGPTVDADGNVIGVNSSHFVGEPFNYAVPAERIAELLASAGVENTVSEVTETYRDGIRAYFDGDRTEAVAAFEAVLDEQPANGLAEDYLAKAKELPAPPAASEEDGFPWLVVLGGAGAAALAGLVGLVLVLRGRGRRRTAAPVPAPVPAGMVPAQPGAAQPVPNVASQPVTSPEPVLVGAAQPAGFTAPVTPAGDAPAGSLARFCTGCGQPAGSAVQFCGSCGTRLG